METRALCLLIVATLSIHDASAFNCNATTGPDGARVCIKYTEFDNYQWATCRNNSYIERATNNKFSCSANYCRLYCMARLFNATKGHVHDRCLCGPGRKNSTSEKADVGTCNKWSGPAGNTHCIKIARYSDYQWGTCRTDVYLKTKSNGDHHCIDRSATYCYYQCMLDVYDKNNGDILPYCKCSPGDPLPTETIPLPAWCHSPDGTNCSWYRECLSKAYPQCKDDHDEYAIQYAEKFCTLYNESFKNFSWQGRNWVNAVRKCLQLKLVPVIDTTRQKTCTELKSAAFETHTPCYLDPDPSAPSYCDLSIGDKWEVFWTIKSAFVDAFGPSLKGLYDVMAGCTRKAVKSNKEKTKEITKKIKEAAVDAITDLAADNDTRILQENTARIKTWLEEALSPSFPFPVQLDLRIGFEDLENFQRRRKRSIEDDLETTRSRLAGKIIDEIAVQKEWQNKGIAWFAYANADNETEHDKNTMSIRFLVTDRSKYESVENGSSALTKSSNLTSTLLELSEAVLKRTLDNLKINGERIEIMALNGCLDWNCEEHTFNITLMKFEQTSVPVTAKPKGNKAAMYTLSSVSIALFVIYSLINIS